MVFPGMPVEPPDPHRRPNERDAPQQRPDDDLEPDLDISRFRQAPPDADLTTVDWLLCVFCSGIACIIGIVRLIQGKPNAGKMIGVALLFSVIWTMLRFALASMSR
jgi:hypothetical protein